MNIITYLQNRTTIFFSVNFLSSASLKHIYIFQFIPQGSNSLNKYGMLVYLQLKCNDNNKLSPCVQNAYPYKSHIIQNLYRQKHMYIHYGFNMARFDEDGDGMQTNELKAFYCISTDIKQTVLALTDTHKQHASLPCSQTTQYSTK